MFEYLFKILDGRLEKKTHAGSVVDADRAVQITAIGDIQKNDIGIVMMTYQAIEFALSTPRHGIQVFFLPIALRIPGNQRFGKPAARTFLHEINFVPPLFAPGGDKSSAFIAESLVVHKNNVPLPDNNNQIQDYSSRNYFVSLWYVIII